MERYKINRIGILNYWLYDEEEFYFYDGKLLLRGTNGSGKSVTMVSFFPLLFDGNKNPERFDTFGSRDRKVEDYVLPSTFDGNENTSYLYMEFYNKELNKYLTIGIGLRAIRNRNVEFYGFAITDNRRMKQDFMLYKDHLRKIPLSKRELQIAIGSGGMFVTSAKEYKKMVNDLLFGFENESLYSELINLMLQLRSPKLSKDYKPTKLEEILSSVLEPLNESDIAVMSDSIENMNKYKEKISDLTIESTALKGLLHSFNEYSNMILYNKAQNYKDAMKDFENTKKKIDEEETLITNLKIKLEEENKRSNEINLELNETEYKINNLDAKDLNQLLQDKASFVDNVNKRKEKKKQKEETLESKEDKRIELEGKKRQIEEELYLDEKNYNNLLEDLESKKEELYYDEISFYLDELKENGANFNFQFLLEDLDKGKEKLKELLKYVEEKEAIKTKKDIEEERVAKIENNIKELEKESREKTNLLLEEIESLKERLNAFSQNQIYILSDDTKEKIIEVLEKLNDDAPYQSNILLKEEYQEIKSNLDKEILVLNQKIDIEKNNITSLEEEKKKANEVLEKNLEYNETKKYLEENNIHAKYLYEVIEFKKDIPLEKRRILEKALKRMGILETFLLHKTSPNLDIKTFDNLTPVKDSLLKYFDVIDPEYREEATNVLKSVSTSIGNVKINLDGNYNIGIISGHVNNDYELKYIGKEARENFITNLIAKIDDLIKNHEKAAEELDLEVSKCKQNLAVLEKEYDKGLNLDNYQNLINELNNLSLRKKVINENMNEIIIKITSLNEQITKIDKEINIEKKYYKGPLTKPELNEVITSFDKVKNLSISIKSLLSGISGKKDMIANYDVSIEDILNLKDETLAEITSIDFEIEDYNRRIKQIDEQISSDKFKNIKEELENLYKKKKALDEEEKTCLIYSTKHQKDLEIAEENLKNMLSTEEHKKKLSQITEKIFMDEYHLKYSSYNEDMSDFNSWFKNFKISKVITPTDASVRFLESMNNYLPKLQNYAGRKTTILNYEEHQDELNEINNLLNNAKRIDVEFRYAGKVLNLIELNEAITLELETTQSLLNEEDRKLFEDLLMNNIGDSIRRKIASSNEWIKEVRNLMETMNTSSGLTFSIKWSGKGKETEEELDTKEIVDIFERDPESLKEEDLQKITNHFRSKITLEEEKYEENERNYLEIIRNVLDYRKWYEFKLYFKRRGFDKKELTDKEFSKFSGGEKAIAMYIPLFAGIYAKFNSARKTAPKVIALDEAFAGVDDDNILDCFRIMDEMDLDYILTSQMLWGDYSTIKHLAICELHSAPESNVVSVIRYKWDGFKRTLVTSEKDYEN